MHRRGKAAAAATALQGAARHAYFFKISPPVNIFNVSNIAQISPRPGISLSQGKSGEIVGIRGTFSSTEIARLNAVR
jgi:hypothetical protein